MDDWSTQSRIKNHPSAFFMGAAALKATIETPHVQIQTQST